jgi:hypothetical protein
MNDGINVSEDGEICKLRLGNLGSPDQPKKRQFFSDVTIGNILKCRMIHNRQQSPPRAGPSA